MATIDKAAFLKRIGGKAAPGGGETVVGPPEPDGDEPMLSPGQRLLDAVKSGDATAVEEAIKACAEY